MPGAQPGACTDTAKPTSSFTRKAARKAGRKRLLRGTAADIGCGVDRVTISVQRKSGKAYKTLFRKSPLLRKLRHGRQHWLAARGTTHWSFRLSEAAPARHVPDPDARDRLRGQRREAARAARATPRVMV